MKDAGCMLCLFNGGQRTQHVLVLLYFYNLYCLIIIRGRLQLLLWLYCRPPLISFPFSLDIPFLAASRCLHNHPRYSRARNFLFRVSAYNTLLSKSQGLLTAPPTSIIVLILSITGTVLTNMVSSLLHK